MANRLDRYDVKKFREELVRSQNHKCPLCKEYLSFTDAVLDHDHTTGYIRCALHRSCNAAEGKVLEWAGKRSRGTNPVTWLKNLLKYWDNDYKHNPIYPTHGYKKKRRRKKNGRN